MNFKGTIVIADTSYIMRGDVDFHTSLCGESLSPLGFSDFLTTDKGGKIARGVFNKANNSLLGELKIPSGYVTVAYLDEVSKYNPQFLPLTPSGYYTVIKDFCGSVEALPTSDKDYPVSIVGRGNINFKTDVYKIELNVSH